jgi:hypothetical protein
MNEQGASAGQWRVNDASTCRCNDCEVFFGCGELYMLGMCLHLIEDVLA